MFRGRLEKIKAVSRMSNEVSAYTMDVAHGWRSFYIRRHDEMTSRAAVLIKFVESCSRSKSLEVHDYLRSIQILCSMDVVFKDVVMLLFASKQNVLLNLIVLHYLMFQLGVPVTDVIEALSDCNISEREVCVKWWKLGRWLHGFRLRDESHSRKVFLGHLALTKEDEVFGVLHRGAIHEVLRVQIFVADVIPMVIQKCSPACLSIWIINFYGLDSSVVVTDGVSVVPFL
ncbi:hypothetical protein GIB67_034517, partial [Kingdonia uniflora]